jgi:hypothetical protein
MAAINRNKGWTIPDLFLPAFKINTTHGLFLQQITRRNISTRQITKSVTEILQITTGKAGHNYRRSKAANRGGMTPKPVRQTLVADMPSSHDQIQVPYNF